MLKQGGFPLIDSTEVQWTQAHRSDRALDAMIAATAIANQLPLYTCNPTTSEG